mgnify:FL=1
MDIGFELETLHRAPYREALASRRAAAPEWPLLRDRLSAGCAARRAMLAAVNLAASRGGSFNRFSARALAAQTGDGGDRSSPPVNLTLSANGKPGDGIAASFAGDSLTGDRGQ